MRTYKRKSERGKTPGSEILQAIGKIVNEKLPVYRVAKEFNIPVPTLDRHYKKLTGKDDSTRNEEIKNLRVGYQKHRQVNIKIIELILKALHKRSNLKNQQLNVNKGIKIL